MPKYEIRHNTERVLLVEAQDEPSALKIAEQTDFSEWDSAESLFEIEQVNDARNPASTVEP